MKAWVSRAYGSPDVMRLEDVVCPAPTDDEVLVDVRGISVNPYDWHYLRGTPRMFRISSGLFRPKNTILGSDIAGVVRKIGKNVTAFKPGDEVFGEAVLGGFAESVCVSQDKLALKPAGLSFDESAALPMASITALQGLRDKGRIRGGQKVLINGASGGVGTFAVQIAKSFDTTVTGVCSTRNLKLVKSIGADSVIDYTRSDFTRSGDRYDLIFDAAGSLSVSDMKRMLAPGGIAAVIGYTSMRRIIHVVFAGGSSIGTMTANTTTRDLELIRGLVESEKVKPVIDSRVFFADLPQALAYLECGHARGKVVISFAHLESPSNLYGNLDDGNHL
ncbi:MAG: NAD(P)-dependent alcohol dehydrogenase [Spirochaetaceae bacterium]|nr:NAD(P)-dependent alcohol dehydrogenase [Spirochaetaceae bacterium]